MKITGEEKVADMPIRLSIATEMAKAIIANPAVIDEVLKGGNSVSATAFKFADDMIREFNQEISLT